MQKENFSFKSIDAKAMAKSIKAIREEHGLKQVEMALIAGVTAQNYHNFESGKINHKLTLDSVYRLMQYFKLPMEIIVGGKKVYANQDTEALIKEIDALRKENSRLEELNAMYKKNLELEEQVKKMSSSKVK